MLDKEVKKNPALLALLGSQEESEPKEEKAPKEKKVKKDARKQNPRGYERYRGKGGTTKPMSYYLPQDIIDLLNIKAAKERKSKSEIVLEGLRYVLREELKESKKSSAEKEEVI